jgi:NADH:ubiquinone oxidoreductase subunit E/NAD-dependent dihydropyrimidine dehydrogenase PreA subunit/ferredoxin
MNKVTLTIDGNQVSALKGMTILEAADSVGITIPRLCHQEGIKPSGNCRICVVEVEGSRTLVGSCHTPAAEGMVVATGSARVRKARQATIELLLAGHTGTCVTDTEARECGLHKLASDLEAGPPRFRVRRPRLYAAEHLSPYVLRDMSKCILCRKCIRACNEVARQGVYGMAYRGFASKVVVDCDVPLNKEVCKDCGICIEYCPTNALLWPEGVKKRKGTPKRKAPGAPFSKSDTRTKLLSLLEARHRTAGYLSEESMAGIAASLQLPLSEVYGVASFYAFLSGKPQGEHVIRVCKSLPCYLKDAPMIIESVNKLIGIKPGETTPDGRFSFALTNCIGACDQAPAMLIDDTVHGNLTPGKIADILKSYREL